MRNQWQGLSRIMNARVQDAGDIAMQYSAWDANGLLKTFAELLQVNKTNENTLKELANTSLLGEIDTLLASKKLIGEVSLIAAEVPNADGKSLRTVADELRNRLDKSIFCLSATNGDKVSLLIAVTDDLTSKYQAGNMIKELAPLVGGRGGGKPQLAQAGGNSPDGLGALFEKCAEYVERA